MIAYRHFKLLFWLTSAVLGTGAARAQDTEPPPPPALAASAASVPAPASAASAVRPSAWIAVPRVAGRLRSADLGLVINTADPYSVAVGEYYAERRGLAPEQVLRVELPVRPALDREAFAGLQAAIAERFGSAVQALALAWVEPYAVACNSITGALALGLDESLCQRSCAASRPSPYFNAPAVRPFDTLGLRPSMLLAAPSVEQARALIDRGVASDGTLRPRGRPPVSAMLLRTGDVNRRVRMLLYPPAGLQRSVGVEVRIEPAEALKDASRVLLAITGAVRPDLSAPVDWVPGALADNLTSFGGALRGAHGQGTALDWIASGATASHGTVSEPCNHLQKFPHPQLLLLNYVQGSSAIEAYWRSVAWPQQGLFIGEPLAAPFALFATPAPGTAGR